jgi:CheY-like chemotaxis protein
MPKTLLLADDSVTIQKVVGLSFASEDIVLVTVSNGDDAVVRARELRPDLVLADIVMPGRNGYEVCEAIKTDPALRHIPVLLLTGTFEAFDQERARRVGADGHVTKPFEAQTLVQQVKDLMARASQAAAQEAAPPSVVEGFDVPTLPPLAEAELAGDPFFEDQLAQAMRFSDDSLDLGPRATAGEPELVTVAEEEPDPDDLLNASEFAPIEPEPVRPGAVIEVFEVSQDSFRGSPVFAPLTADIDLLSPRAVAPESASLLPDDDFDLGFDEPPFAAAAEAEAANVLELLPPASRFGADDPAEDAMLDLRRASSYDLSFSHLEDPLATSRGEHATALGTILASEDPLATSRGKLDVSLGPIPALAARPAAPTEPELESLAAPPPDAAATSAAGHSVDLSPALRQRLHDTLEKVAWEAFADLSDTIVRQALERIESIAWEVIPQMAEQLIREEIRRMKDDREDS